MKIVISGTSSGIGKAIALKFLKEGHDVIGIDIAPSAIGDAHYTHAQVSVVDGALPNVDPDIVIVSHGVQEEENAISVNLEGAIRLFKTYEESKNLKSVLFIASSSARSGAEFPLYSASKGGLVTYMKNAATRLASSGVTVNAISPGAVITPANDHILKDEKKKQAVANESLLKKWATAEEIAEWAYFITVINKSMTGEDVLVDNGEWLKSNFIW